MVVQRPMHLRTAVAECLDYIQNFVPPFDEALLQTPLQLPRNLNTWGPILDSAPSTLALRSAALQPFARLLVDSKNFYEHDLDTALAAFQNARRHLNAARHNNNHHLNLEEELNRPYAFMIVETASSLSDGAACVASHGYFDDHNIPPWDTWVKAIPLPDASGSELGLLCWVPDWAKQHVEDGIAVNPEECLHWAEIQDDRVLWQ